MPNITVSVSQSAYRDARIWAATHNTSVSAIVQYCIERLPNMKVSIKGTAATDRGRKKAPYSAARASSLTNQPSASPRGEQKSGCETVKSSTVE